MGTLCGASCTVNPESDPAGDRHALPSLSRTTGWRVIQGAQGTSDAAIQELGILIEHYREYICRCIGKRLRDFDPADAEAALVHVEFPKLVRRAYPNGQKGRFRSLIRRAVDNYVISVLRGETFELPREGDEPRQFQRRLVQDEAIDDRPAESEGSEVDEHLDTEFALLVMRRALAGMRLEAVGDLSGADALEVLIFPPDNAGGDQQQAERLGISTGALRVRRTRARSEFGARYGQLVMETVAPEDLEDETRYLLSLVCRAKCCTPFHKP